jgi:pimeloyl-ACP methyl ester carboxylesterase
LAAPPAPAAEGARVLASPKARALAAERGLDLRRLVAAGNAEPIRAADVARFRAPAAAATSRIAATARAEALAAFRALLRAEAGETAGDAALWAAFAAGALRPHHPGAIVVAVESFPAGGAARYADPDVGPLAALAPAGAAGATTLTLRDLTGGRLAEAALARDTGPVLCVAGGGDAPFALTLTWPADALSETAALDLVAGMIARIEQPLLHLL